MSVRSIVEKMKRESSEEQMKERERKRHRTEVEGDEHQSQKQIREETDDRRYRHRHREDDYDRHKDDISPDRKRNRQKRKQEELDSPDSQRNWHENKRRRNQNEDSSENRRERDEGQSRRNKEENSLGDKRNRDEDRGQRNQDEDAPANRRYQNENRRRRNRDSTSPEYRRDRNECGRRRNRDEDILDDERNRDENRNRRNPDKYKSRRNLDEDESKRNQDEVNTEGSTNEKKEEINTDDGEEKPKKSTKASDDMNLLTRTGGAYIPPAKLKMMQAQITDKSSIQYQRLAWEALKKSIHGLVNKVNISNIIQILPELFQLNIVRGRGLLSRSIMQAQAASPTFTNVYAALVAIVNSKFPNIGQLILKRLIVSFQKGYKRNDKVLCLSSLRFIAHLVNQLVSHEILALEVLMLLMENPTNDSVELAIGFLKECGNKLKEVASRSLNAVFERLRVILHEAKLETRVQYMIEVMFAIRKDGFKDHPFVVDGLDQIEEDEQVTHTFEITDTFDTEDGLNIFKFDQNFEENETKYNDIKKEVLGEDSDEDAEGSNEEDDEEDEDNEESKTLVIDNTETNLTAFRRIVYLTIQSSADFEECAHKLLKMQMKPGQEEELCNMILDCCAQQRTYEKFYGLLGQRFCMIDKKYLAPYEKIFQDQYKTIHRLETNKLRNVAKFFAHLLHTDAISWQVLQNLKMTEEDTTSSGRIFIKYLFQELSEYMGLTKLNARLKDPTLQPYFEGLFPRDDPKNTRFSINFFTSIGLGGLTDELRNHLQSIPKQTKKLPTPVNSSESSSDSSCESSSSDDDSSDSSSETESSSDSDSPSSKERSGKKSQNLKKSSNSKAAVGISTMQRKLMEMAYGKEAEEQRKTRESHSEKQATGEKHNQDTKHREKEHQDERKHDIERNRRLEGRQKCNENSDRDRNRKHESSRTCGRNDRKHDETGRQDKCRVSDSDQELEGNQKYSRNDKQQEETRKHNRSNDQDSDEDYENNRKYSSYDKQQEETRKHNRGNDQDTDEEYENNRKHKSSSDRRRKGNDRASDSKRETDVDHGRRGKQKYDEYRFETDCESEVDRAQKRKRKPDEDSDIDRSRHHNRKQRKHEVDKDIRGDGSQREHRKRQHRDGD